MIRSVKGFFLHIFLLCLAADLGAQELFVFSEPASNMPANSLSHKITGHYTSGAAYYNKSAYRVMPQLMLGVNKNLMVHVGMTFANMHQPYFGKESFNFYLKYRFLSNDDIHKHFRMAAFFEASSTKNRYHFDENGLMGDKDGMMIGVIATQLWNKFALSGTLAHTQGMDESRFDKVYYVPSRLYQYIDYSLSGGLLVFPKEYTDYKQTNMNVYLELLGEQAFERSVYYLDLAPAIQLIFNSNSKLNLGYRFQLTGNMSRMSRNSWQLSYERTFLNALKK